ncbi:hypothetical protein J1TS3_17820 [Siminovitchia fordii]|uniref:Uncharacterized protein n=1 Tax=Siminovitchia fordii TaxID=254759 RepID=A0ABQ4K4I7_9BACI|nr:hypothetical protein J1TS3_17820 [Siminovitchia fordii]
MSALGHGITNILRDLYVDVYIIGKLGNEFKPLTYSNIIGFLIAIFNMVSYTTLQQ